MPADTSSTTNANSTVRTWLAWFALLLQLLLLPSQFPANETKFFGVWHKSSFQLAAEQQLVQFILARSPLFGSALLSQAGSESGRQAVSRLYKMDLLPTVEL